MDYAKKKKTSKQTINLVVLLIMFCLNGCHLSKQKYYIKETLKDGAIACAGDSCEDIVNKDCDYYAGLFVFHKQCTKMRNTKQLFHINKIKGINYADGLVFTLPDGIEDNDYGEVYEYTTQDNVKHTLSRIEFEKVK